MLSTIFSFDTLWYLMLLLYVPACILLIAVVLLQKGKGMGFAGAFGTGGGTEAVFGPRAVRSLPQKITYTMAGLFMVIAMLMSMLSGRVGKGSAPAMVPEEDMTSNTVNKIFDEKKDGAPAADANAAAPAAPNLVTTPVTPAPADGAAAPTEAPAAPAPAAEAPAAPAAEAPAAAPAAEAPAAPAPAPAQ